MLLQGSPSVHSFRFPPWQAPAGLACKLAPTMHLVDALARMHRDLLLTNCTFAKLPFSPGATPDSRSTLSSTTVVDTPPRSLQDDQEVREVAPPTPGAHVTRDPEHPYMSTPARANQVTTTTPADSAKKAGDNDGHPINLN